MHRDQCSNEELLTVLRWNEDMANRTKDARDKHRYQQNAATLGKVLRDRH